MVSNEQGLPCMSDNKYIYICIYIYICLYAGTGIRRHGNISYIDILPSGFVTTRCNITWYFIYTAARHKWSLNPQKAHHFSWASYIHYEISGRTWWCHQMESFSALLSFCAGNSPVTGDFSTQRPVTRSFDVFFDLRLTKRLGKQSWGWWFETERLRLRQVYSTQLDIIQMHDIRHTWQFLLSIIQYYLDIKY